MTDTDRATAIKQREADMKETGVHVNRYHE